MDNAARLLPIPQGIEEPLRTLRSNILLRLGPQSKCFLITSAVAGEGKTTICASLASVLSRAGTKVLLIDADLRSPSLHKVFGVSNQKGFSQLLTGTPLNEVCCTITGGLTLVTSGPAPSDPQQLLLGGFLRSSLIEARNVYDAILLDSSPVLESLDPALIASRTDGVLVVMSAGKVTHPEAGLLRHKLESVGGKLLGSVLNAFDAPNGALRRAPVAAPEETKRSAKAAAVLADLDGAVSTGGPK
jgi:capsular exopolysaccharide synthesis family protein